MRSASSSAALRVQLESRWTIALSEPMYDLVAATLRSVPAPMSMAYCAILMSGESGVLQIATTNAPPARAFSTDASRSGLLPDCEIARHTEFSRFMPVSYTELIEGAAEDVRTCV